MKELLKDLWALIESLAVAGWDILCSAAQLVYVEDPFLRGVVTTLVAGLLIMKWKQIESFLDRVPVIGGLLVFLPRKLREGVGFLSRKAKEGLSFLKSKTIDPVSRALSKADKDLRE